MAKTYYMRFGSGDPRTYTGLSPTFLIFSQNGTNVTPPSIAEVTGATGIYSFSWGTTTSIAFLADAATTSPGSSGRYVVGSLDPADRIDEVGSTLIAFGTTLVAIGTSNIALGTTNVALGTTNVAIGTSNISLGTTNVALGTSNIALGTTNFALGTTAVAIGTSSIALGTTAVAIGTSNIALGTTNIALGTSNVALGTSNFAANTTLLAMGTSNAYIIASIGSSNSSFGTNTTDPTDLFGYLKRVQELLEGNNTYTKSTGVLDIYSRGSSQLLREKTFANNSTQVTKT